MSYNSNLFSKRNLVEAFNFFDIRIYPPTWSDCSNRLFLLFKAIWLLVRNPHLYFWFSLKLFGWLERIRRGSLVGKISISKIEVNSSTLFLAEV